MNFPTYQLVGTVQAVQPLATCSKDLADRQGGTNQPIPIPTITTFKGGQLHHQLYFPASGFRGKLRRSAVAAVRDALIKATGKPHPFTLDEHFLLTLGGVKGGGSMARISMKAEADWLSRNPLLSVFGAGDGGDLGFVRGQLNVGNCFCDPSLQATIFSGARTDDLYRDKFLGRYLSDADLDQLVSRAESNRKNSGLKADLKSLTARMKTAIKAGELATAEALQAEITALEAEKSSENSIGMPLSGYKAIPPSAEMAHKLMLTRVTSPHQLGLLLAGFNYLSRDPVLGAHGAQGCGEIAFSYEVFEVLDGKRQSIGTIRGGDFVDCEIEGERLRAVHDGFMNDLMAGKFDFSIPEVKPRHLAAYMAEQGIDDSSDEE